MTILDKIILDKRKEIAFKKSIMTISSLEKSALFHRPPISLRKNLVSSKFGIIAEFKRRSPSRSEINYRSNVWEIAQIYENASMGGMSVLTEGKYFGGSLEDLILARASTKLPILRKEFIVDEFQILEAKAYGADAVLLIAAVLSRKAIESLSQLAQSLAMEVILEVHNEQELVKSLMPSLDIIGVNNRNLSSFEVSLETSLQLVDKIPNEMMKISESGLRDVQSIKRLRKAGFDGFLIGEHFMASTDVEKKVNEFVQKLN